MDGVFHFMDIFDAKDISNNLGFKAGGGLGLLFVFLFVSTNEGIPPAYVWIGGVLVAGIGYFLLSTLIFGLLMARYFPQPAQPEPQAQPAAQPTESQPEPNYPMEPITTVRGLIPARWLHQTDWPKLAQWILEARPISKDTLSRAQIVDQRFYCLPDDQGLKFPLLMVKIGAAVPKENQGYRWTMEAYDIINQLVSQLGARPTPKNNNGLGG